MLNQCIFVGRIEGTESSHEDKLSLKIEVPTGSDHQKNIIKVDVSKDMILQDMLIRGSMIAVKCHVISIDGEGYTFIADRITMLGGQSNA
jgi:hypothetical protein